MTTLYDEVEYPSQVVPQAHPEVLALAARARGLRPAPPERCRILDLGCGSGTNLLSLAMACPGIEAVGIDLAERPVAAGNSVAAEAGLTNVRFIAADASRPDPAWGTFDYVTAHGVYSWVPEAVRDGLLETVRSVLRPDGVAFVSYGAYPGARLPGMFREMMLLHSRGAATVEERMLRSRELLRAVAVGRRTGDDPLERWLRSEAERHLATPDTVLVHDDLAEVNDPVWFHEFARHAAARGLRYLCEAEWPENNDLVFAPQVREALAAIEDPLAREQTRDLIKVRRFRQSLLVHAHADPQPPRIDDVDALYVTARVVPGPPAPPLSEKVAETFVSARAGRVETDSRTLRAALHILAERSPHRTRHSDLVTEACARAAAANGGASPADEAPADLAAVLQTLHESGFVDWHLTSPAVADAAGERPVATPLARSLAARQARVPSLLHEILRFDDSRARRLLPLLDGTRTRAEILVALLRADEPPGAAPAGAPPLTAELLEITLTALVRHGYLVA